MPTLTWGFLMLKFLRSKLKLKKLTHKKPPEPNQKSARKFNQKKTARRRSLKHLHAVLKQDPLLVPSTPAARRPQGIEKESIIGSQLL